MNVNRCPKCRVELEPSGRCAECGWSKREQAAAPERRYVPCAFEGCPSPGIYRVRIGPLTPGKERHNWANVCSEHDVALVTQEAKEWLRSVGLDRQPGESMKVWMGRTIDWLKANGEKHKRVKGFKNAADLLVKPRQREPGDDDEEIAA